MIRIARRNYRIMTMMMARMERSHEAAIHNFGNLGNRIIETRSSNTSMIMLPTLRSRTMTSEMHVSSITIPYV